MSVVKLSTLLVLPALLLAAEPARATDFKFDRTDWVEVGNGVGAVHAGDIDGDGDLDIVGVGGRNIFVVENTGPDPKAWPLSGNLDSTDEAGLNGYQLYDVDHDGDLDIVGAKYKSDLGWWENPGVPFANKPWYLSAIGFGDAPWRFHVIATGVDGWFLHDLIRADLDRDGVSEEFVAVLVHSYWNAPFHVYWFKPTADPKETWEKHVVTQNQSGPNNDHAGVDAGDIDGDGDIDLSFSNGWFESSGDPGGPWTWHEVTDIYGISNSLIRDMNRDGHPDLVMAAGHHGQGVYWFENTGDPRSGGWRQHNISAVRGDLTVRHVYSGPEDGADHLHHPECLQVADLDGDGDPDVVTCDLFFGEDPGEPNWRQQVHNVYVFENIGGNPPRWRKQNVSPNSWPSHLLYLVDIDRDGRLDIITEAPKINSMSFLRNVTDRK